MDCSKKIAPGDAGFTLIEVAVAVTILAIALATLVGLQTRLIDNYLHERNLFRATLAAQYLISFLEIEQDPPEPSETEGNLIDALSEKGYFADNLSAERQQSEMRDWKLRQSVTSVDYAEFQDILRRIEFRISWGEAANDGLSLVLFLNTNKTQQIGQQLQQAGQ